MVNFYFIFVALHQSVGTAIEFPNMFCIDIGIGQTPNSLMHHVFDGAGPNSVV